MSNEKNFDCYLTLCVEKRTNALDESFWLFKVRETSCGLDEFQSRRWDGSSVRCSVVPRSHEAITRAPKKQSRNIYPMQTTPQLWVMKIWFPGIERRRLTIACHYC